LGFKIPSKLKIHVITSNLIKRLHGSAANAYFGVFRTQETSLLAANVVLPHAAEELRKANNNVIPPNPSAESEGRLRGERKRVEDGRNVGEEGGKKVTEGKAEKHPRNNCLQYGPACPYSKLQRL